MLTFTIPKPLAKPGSAWCPDLHISFLSCTPNEQVSVAIIIFPQATQDNLVEQVRLRESQD